MKLDKKFITQNCLIVSFSIIFFCFALFNFINFEPRHDQAFHITWLQNLILSDHFLPENFFQNFKSLLTDKKGFVYELFKPANNPVDYHAYLFQINSVLTVYFFSFILKLSSIQTYNLVSILFASLSIITNYQILVYYLKKNKIFNENLTNIIIAQILYCSLNIVFYKYYFSPLGHHNIAYFIFSIVIIIFLRVIDKETNYKYTKLGCVLGFAVYYQITIGLLLLPFFSLLIIFQNNKMSINNLINFLKFISSFCILLSPFIILLINDFNNIDKNFFTVLLGSEGNELEFYLRKIVFWFTALYSLSTPFVFVGFLFSLIISYKLKKFNEIQFIILTHFIINIILSIFYISYLRNFYYILNLIIILSSLTFIYVFFKKEKLYKFLIISITILSLIYNLNIISDKDNLASKETLFYKTYFKEQGNITEKLKKIKSVTSNNKIIFFSDYSKNYLSAFDRSHYQNKILIDKPLVNLSNHINNDSRYSQIILAKHPPINENFILISLAENFNYPKKIFRKLKNAKMLSTNCTIDEKHLINELIFHDTGSGIFNVRLFVTNINC